MDRRTFLTLATTGALSGLSGCTIGARSDIQPGSTAADTPDADTNRETTATETGESKTATATPSTTETERPVKAVAGVELPIPKRKLTRGAGKNAIPAITDPAFAEDWSDLVIAFRDPYGEIKKNRPRLQPEDRVIGVERDGVARAYPLRVLNWHEIVNDSLGGPLLVTYCPLCRTGMVAKRIVNGEKTIFGVSGLLWNSNLVMFDQLTESYWSQAAATAIRGPEIGERLSLIPSTFTTWKEWRSNHPETEVLLPPPRSTVIRGAWQEAFNYKRNPYETYENSDKIGIGENSVPEGTDGLHPKTEVLGIATDSAAKAYPLDTVKKAGLINDSVGKLPVVVTVTPNNTTLVGYERQIDGKTLQFEKVSETHMHGGGSRWKITTGRAVGGPYEGSVLTPATKTPQMYWFAWADFNPGTAIYAIDS